MPKSCTGKNASLPSYHRVFPGKLIVDAFVFCCVNNKNKKGMSQAPNMGKLREVFSKCLVDIKILFLFLLAILFPKDSLSSLLNAWLHHRSREPCNFAAIDATPKMSAVFVRYSENKLEPFDSSRTFSFPLYRRLARVSKWLAIFSLLTMRQIRLFWDRSSNSGMTGSYMTPVLSPFIPCSLWT